MKTGLVLATTLLAVAPALAQTSAPAPREPGPPVLTTPGVPPTGVVQGGSPDIANSGPAATGTLARSGTGADTFSNNTAATSNASNPARAIPNVGGGGGDGGSGQ